MTSQPGVVARARACLWELADLVLPAECGGCGLPGSTWCAQCAAWLRGACAFGPRRGVPQPCPPALPPVWTSCVYTGPLRQAVVAWKDSGRRDLTGVLAPVLRSSLAGVVAADAAVGAALRGRAGLLLVPVPSSGASVRHRGDVPMVQLATRAIDPVCRAAGMSLAPVLRMSRPVADQAGLDHHERAANLAGAMQVRRRDVAAVSGAVCVVLDDVLTTGATLVEASRALRAQGAAHVAAATMAATERRGAGGRQQEHLDMSPTGRSD